MQHNGDWGVFGFLRVVTAFEAAFWEQVECSLMAEIAEAQQAAQSRKKRKKRLD